MFSLFRYLKKTDYLKLIICVGLIVLQVWLELKMPDYTKNLTTMVNAGNASNALVWKNGGLMLACAGGSLVASILCTILISNLASGFSKTLREKLFYKISSFSHSEIKKFSSASLITRTTNDVVQVQNFMAMGVQLLIKAPIMAIWAICKISSTDVSLTVAVLISVVLMVASIGVLIGLNLPRFKKIQKLTDNASLVTQESVSGVRVIRAFNAENYEEEKFEKVNKELTSNHLFTSRTMGLLSPILTLVLNGLTLAIYFIGAILINKIAFNGNASEMVLLRATELGNITAFSQYAMQVVTSFIMLVMIFIILPRVLVSSGRIKEVLNTASSINDGENKAEETGKGEIEFKDVNFRFNDSSEEEMALENISFKIEKGQTVAIIGATGSAKTTLVNLINRVYDVSSGIVLVDNKNVQDYLLEELNQKVAVASQKAVLFKGTIKENVALGEKEPNEERIIEALKTAQADFVFDLEKGIDSEVSQGGTNFSGGQKQRLSIARAIYKNAEILIFDDTFSALDYKTDMLARKAIKEKMKDATIIIVAQRIGTIKDADVILVLDNGKIVGKGTHAELLNSCPLYKEIALSQLSKEEL
ncbi:MAG: ABC transporter ATP-binding protein [Clostridia bacterium]|nr:ABC transporter ATP-binding protein [Clostridia bacterium]